MGARRGGRRSSRVREFSLISASFSLRVYDWRLLVVDEISGARGFEQLVRQLSWLAAILRQRNSLIDQVARVTAAEGDLARPVVVLQQVVDERGIERNATLTAAVLENAGELGDGRTLREHLVVNSAEERFVDQFGRLDVRGEDHQYVERQLELLS